MEMHYKRLQTSRNKMFSYNDYYPLHIQMKNNKIINPEKERRAKDVNRGNKTLLNRLAKIALNDNTINKLRPRKVG